MAAEARDLSALDDAVGAEAYRVHLDMFDGPLDLLLHLIKKHELDILDIPVGFVSKKYNEYLRAMEVMSIDIAAEYLVMAATLAYIKSRMLLPPDPNQAEEEEESLEDEADPRAELIRRLLEYQKYKDAAEQLGSRDVLGRDIFPRGTPIDATIEKPPLAQLSLFKLVDAFESVLKRAKISEDHQIDFERITISEKIGHISDRLQLVQRLRFEDLFDGDVSRAEMIVTFLALLEMTKLRMTNISQAGPMEPIFIELAVLEDGDRRLEPERAPGGRSKASPADLDEGGADEDEGDMLASSLRTQRRLVPAEAEEWEDDDDGLAEPLAADEHEEVEGDPLPRQAADGQSPELSAAEEVARLSAAAIETAAHSIGVDAVGPSGSQAHNAGPFDATTQVASSQSPSFDNGPDEEEE